MKFSIEIDEVTATTNGTTIKGYSNVRCQGGRPYNIMALPEGAPLPKVGETVIVELRYVGETVIVELRYGNQNQ